MGETVYLYADATLVPEFLLEPLFTNDRRGVMGDLASSLLDRHLRRLSRMQNPVELQLARMLGQMQRHSGYLDLGFARMADYVTERLGIRTRRMQLLLQMQKRLANLSEITAAFEREAEGK